MSGRERRTLAEGNFESKKKKKEKQINRIGDEVEKAYR
jgi:hypothetical protein